MKPISEEEHICSICGKKFVGWGNNPWPVTTGKGDRCCDECNATEVLLARIKRLGGN